MRRPMLAARRSARLATDGGAAGERFDAPGATARPRRAGPSADRALDVLFVAAVLAQLVPLAVLPYLVTVDGPAHLAGASVLAHAGDPAYRHFFSIDLFPSPNLLSEFVLAGLLRVVGPVTAEKVLVGGYLVLLPVALGYAVRGVDRRAGWLAFAALPLGEGYLFWYGFYNYCYGIAVALVVVGWAVRHHRRWTPLSALVLAGLLVLCYFTHLVPFGIALMVVAVLAVADVRQAPRGPSERGARSKRWLVPRQLAAPLLAVTPSLALIAAFLVRGGAHAAPSYSSIGGLVGGLASLITPIVTYDVREAAFAALMAVTLAVLVVLAVRARGSRATSRLAAPLGAAVALAVVLYLAVPDRFGLQYGYLNARLSVFPVLLLVLWLAAARFSVGVRRGAVGALVLAAVGLGVLHWPVQHHYSDQVAEYLDVTGHVPAGATMVALRYRLDSPPGGPVRNVHFDPLLHVADLVAAQARAVDIGLFSAELNYFPVGFRPGHDLRRRIDPSLRGLEQVPPRVDLAAATTPAGDRIDYVLLVDADHAPADDPVLRQVRAAYRLVYVTGPTGLVQLWARR